MANKLFSAKNNLRAMKVFSMVFALFILPVFGANAQNVSCPPNIDFENGDFSNWECWLGKATDGTPATNQVFFGTPSFISGPVAGRHMLMTTPPVSLDPYGHFPTTPSGGGTYALKLGRDTAEYCAERVNYYVHVPVGFNDYSFNFRFAAVLQDPDFGNNNPSTWSHQFYQRPSFRIRAYDSATGDSIPCATQNFIASAALVQVYGFQHADTGFGVYYLPWTGSAIPIIGQGGKTVVLEVTALDCSFGGHWGYGYFDVISCGKYKAAVTYCNLDSDRIRFVGTGITQVYNWYTSNWTYLGQGAYIDLPVPKTPQFYYGVLAAGQTGCLDTIKTDTIANFTLTTPDACVKFGNPIQLSTTTTGGIGPFNYTWNPNGELSCLTCYNPVASPISPTEYYVKVADRIGCFRHDTVHIFQAPDAGPDRLVCPLGDRPAKLYVGGPATATYTWYTDNGQLANFITPNPGQTVYAAPPNPVTNVYVYSDVCKMYDTVVITHDVSNYIVAPQDVQIVCRPSYLNLQSEAKGPNPKLNIPCGGNNPIACTTETTVTAGYGQIPASTRMNNPFYAKNIYHKYQFVIPKQELLDAGFYSGTINSLALFDLSQTYVGTMEGITISLACVPYSEFTSPATNTTFEPNPQLVFSADNYPRTPNSWNNFKLDEPYSWDTTTNLLVDICIGARTAADPNDTAGVAMVHGSSIQKDDDLINVCGGNAKKVYGYDQRPSVQISFCETPDLPFKYTWSPGTFLNDSTQQNPTAFVSKSIDYNVFSKGLNGCLLKTPLHIIMPIHDLGIGPNDSTACRYQPVPMFATGADGYQWYEDQGGVFTDASGSLSCTNCSNPIATPAATTKYAVIYTNDVNRGNPNNPGSADGCPDTLFTTLHINQLPAVITTNRDTTIKFGSHVQLFAMGASTYTWTPVGSLNDPNSPAPIATPRETTS
ncbi:MAG: hypothetical protein ABI378_08605, partial [Chitinophagaceae bacterium]